MQIGEILINDRGHENDGFSGNIHRDSKDDSRIHRYLRYRHSDQDLQRNSQRIKPFYHEVTPKVPHQDIDTPSEAPFVFPVESFGDSSNGSSRSNFDSPRSNELSDQQSPRSVSDQLRISPQSDQEDTEDIHL